MNRNSEANLSHSAEATHFNSIAIGVGNRLMASVVRHGCVLGFGKRINPIERREVAVHVYQENRNVDKLLPRAPMLL